MVPYFPQPFWRLAAFTIHGFGAAVAVALVVSFCLTLRCAPAYGVISAKASNVFVAATLSGLAGGCLVGLGSGLSGTGLALGAALAVGIAAWRDRSWRLLDLFAYVFPFLLALARTGCFLAHDHVGRLTTSWLGVRFPGGVRFDLGLLYALSASVVAAVVLVISRGGIRSGLMFGVVMALLSITRLIIVRLGASINLTDEMFAGLAFISGCLVVVSVLVGGRHSTPVTE